MKNLFQSLVFLLLFLSRTAFGAEFQIFTEELPPFNYTENGKVTGFSTEIVLEICKRVGHPQTVRVVPWARGYSSILNKDGHILFSMTRTPKRETLFKWIGPIYEPTIVFFAKTGSTLAINSLDDAKKVQRIGTYLKDAEETLLVDAGFVNLVSVGDDFLSPKKLIRGRIDLWIAGDLEG
jgi:polar amino acid transport system substrate-binding protein